MKASICLEYKDESEVWFDFECSEPEHSAKATLLMVCRGTLMASSAVKITAYNDEGFDICSYIK